MAVELKLRRDVEADIDAMTPAEGELIYDITNKRLRVGDGSTAGGTALAVESETATGSTTARTMADRFAEVYNVKDYSAVGDGTTDDAAAIQAAIDAAEAAGGGIVEFPVGQYLHSGLTIDNHNVHLKGLGGHSFETASNDGVRLICSSATANHLTISDGFHILVEDILFHPKSGVTPTAGAAINIVETASGNSADVVIRRCRTDGVFNAILVDGASRVTLENLNLRGSLGNFNIKLTGVTKRIDIVRLRDVTVDTLVSGGSTTCDGLIIGDDVHTTYAEFCHFLKCKRGVLIQDEGGTAPEFIRFNSVDVENSNTVGFSIEECDHLWATDTFCGLSGTHGWFFAATFIRTALLVNAQVNANERNGILINGSGGIHILQPRIGGNSQETVNTFHGISIGVDVDDVHIIGGRIGGDTNFDPSNPKQRNGVIINTGTSDNITIIGVDARGNDNKGIANNGTGTSHQVFGNLPLADEDKFVLGGGAALTRHLSATAALDFDLTSVASQDLTITVTGAALGDSVEIGVPNGSVTADTLFWGWVSAANTVTIRAMRIAGTPNPASGTFRADVWKH